MLDILAKLNIKLEIKNVVDTTNNLFNLNWNDRVIPKYKINFEDSSCIESDLSIICIGLKPSNNFEIDNNQFTSFIPTDD